jgi:hypothetical protein
MRRLFPALAAAILFSAILTGAAAAQSRTYTVYRAQTAPKIDGHPDDECWRAVPWQTGFALLGGGAVSEATQTQFAMVWDDQCLYIAVRCKEPALDHLVAKADDGSNDVFRDDHVEIFLAPEKQREDYIQFAVNSLNKRIDLTYEAKKVTATLAVANGGKWVSACLRDKASWDLEMALPLAALKLEPAEGAVCAGNIARVRRAEQADQPINFTWTPLSNGFDRDPAAFGVFKLAGAPPPMMRTLSLAVEQRRDVVTTLQGDRYTGAVLGIGADGWLHLSGPQFGNEVTVAASVLAHIEFSPARAEKAGARITLGNGDYVLGQVQSITPGQTVIVNPEIGTLTAPTASLSEILMGAGAPANSVDTGFESESLDPWKSVQGNWSVGGGKATYTGGPQGEGVLSVPLDQKGPVTFVADVESLQPPMVQCELVVFSGQPNHQNMRSGVSFHFWGGGGQVTVITPENGYQQLGNWNGNQMGAVSRIQLQYDPKEGSIQPWVGDTPAGQYRFNGGPKTGRYVLFIAHGPMAVKHLRVVPGLIAPGKAPTPATDSVQVALLNGDTISAKGVTFAEGKFTVITEFGNIEPELKRVESVRFPHRVAAPAAAAKEAEAIVQTTEGTFTLRSCALAEDRLTGQSDLFGPVSLKRDVIRSIRFRRSAP